MKQRYESHRRYLDEMKRLDEESAEILNTIKGIGMKKGWEIRN